MDLQLSGKIALITGSNRGTGEIIAQTLSREGAEVVFHSNAEGDCDTSMQHYLSSRCVWGDLSTANGAAIVLQQLEENNIHIDILVNNYGTAGKGSWVQSSGEEWIDMYQKNVLSAMTLIQGLVEPMKEKGWGRIVQMGTVGSHQPNSIMPHYYAAKGALATMSVSLTKELSHTGITVNTVSPGYIRTAELEALFTHRAKKKGWGESWHEVQAQIVEHDFPNPCGRIAEREEVADLVSFLCSERAAFINGQNIRIDGGAVAYV
jgi:NAD(P)-dependent dehydrogenase (short-subunit alcohol dehydrogenase family)